MKKTRKCRECGVGTIRPTSAAGRTQAHKGIRLLIPDDLEIPTCDNCGAEWLTSEVADAIDEALEHRYQAELRRRFDDALSRLRAQGISLATLEKVMRLSQGYLSKLRSPSSEKKLTATLVSHLMLLAKDPRRVQEAESLWEGPAVETQEGSSVHER